MDGNATDMGLGLEVELFSGNLVGPGRSAIELNPSVVRPLEVADLQLLAGNRGTQAVNLKKLSQRHHALARLIAAGTPPGEAGLITGYQGSRVSNLQNDPAFNELVAFYADKVDSEFRDTMAQIAGLGHDAIVELRDRLEDDPDSFAIKDLTTVAQLALDRSGHGPSATVKHEVGEELGARIERARVRALEARRAQARGEVIPEAEVLDD